MNSSSKRVILLCEACGERIVLGEPLSVWYSESTHFECVCGKELTLADRLDQQRVSRAEETTSAARPISPLYR